MNIRAQLEQAIHAHDDGLPIETVDTQLLRDALAAIERLAQEREAAERQRHLWEGTDVPSLNIALGHVRQHMHTTERTLADLRARITTIVEHLGALIQVPRDDDAQDYRWAAGRTSAFHEAAQTVAALLAPAEPPQEKDI